MEQGVWILALIVVVAHGVQAITGFGSSILSLTFGSFVAPVDHLLPVLVPLNLGVPAYLAARYWRDIDGRELGLRIIPFAGLGLALGFAIYVSAAPPWLAVVYAAFVVVIAGLRLVASLREGEGAAVGERPSPLWLIAGGLIHGLFATGGPLLILYTSAVIPDKQRFRCTMSAVWLLLNLALVIGYALQGSLSAATLRETLMLVPAIVVGIVGGELLHRRVSQRSFRIAIFALLLVAGLLLLRRALVG
ncbi:MAG: sulfite exporter TauE/SafE family protein [Myxococcales bacterium]|nr:sulfite exporter TauE/SafE family protein [Myxococcales bacterium]MCB9705916.1 sulfite exporter TauE/SafE family protein [Myxococcales bacterium]